MYQKLIIAVLCLMYVFGKEISHEEKEFMDIMDVLPEEYDENTGSEEVEATQPVYKDDLWQCGICDKIDGKKLVYVEQTDVETNENGEFVNEVQVSLDLEVKINCITISACDSCQVRVVSGTCARAVTLSLFIGTSGQVTVRVYEE